MNENIKIKNEEDILRHKPVMLFGRDVTEIKCFRDSFICGFCTSVAGGLGTFLFTSKTLFSTHMAFVSLWVGVFAYWIPCRYKFENEVLLLEELKKKKNEKFFEVDKPLKSEE